MNWKTRRKRIAAVKEAAQTANTMFSRCRVVGCRHTARAGAGEDRRFRRLHADTYSRHGDPYGQGSLPAATVNPYHRAAMRWLKANAGEVWVAYAIDRARGLMESAWPPVEAFRLRGLTPASAPKRHSRGSVRLRSTQGGSSLPGSQWSLPWRMSRTRRGSASIGAFVPIPTKSPGHSDLMAPRVPT
jgi:hypothetical protein